MTGGDWRSASRRPPVTAGWCGCCGWLVPAAVLLALASIVVIQVLVNSFPSAAEVYRRRRRSGGMQHQDHHGNAASCGFLNRPASLRSVGQGRDPGSHQPRQRRTSNAWRAKVMMEDKSTVTMDARTGIFRQQAADAGPAQGHLPAVLHRLRGEALRRPISISTRER